MSSPFKELALRNAVHVDKRADLPPHTGQCWYIRSSGGCFALKGTNRQLMDQLMKTPIYASSRMKMSAYIDKLRKAGAPIETHFYTNAGTGGRFGVYALAERVTAQG
ncbi:MAG: hypothetical protein P1U75_16880 [Antarcticimicrobium sp.]|uniref:winged helix domain-containing protein n=1 Tax=Antarcticimicrobium sp. TaxID=2824147 RepID=UPI00261C948D|nr:hypothetical protein [Antarcticimicrobium sp.]MDF1718328.1 hypothetical protein [Antarcticimicrobium sp.]